MTEADWIPAFAGMTKEGGAGLATVDCAGKVLVPVRPAALRHALGEFTPDRQRRFCDHLSVSGNVRAACSAAGSSPQTAYRWRRRCAKFALAWDAALVLAREHAEAVLAERALDGVDEPVFYHGEEVARRRRFDSRLLLAHLGRLDMHFEKDGEAVDAALRFDDLLDELAPNPPETRVNLPKNDEEKG